MDPFEGEAASSRVNYEPISVKDLLVQMKDTAELMIDLAYSAVLHHNEALAEEVVHLEERMDVLDLRAQMSLLMAARNPSDAEQLAPVLSIVAATDQISDAAGDIAKIVMEDIRLPDAMRSALPEAVETLVRGVAAPDTTYTGRTLNDIDLESATGVRVLALRRGDEWLLNPDRNTRIKADDVVLMRGPDTAIDDVYTTLTGEPYQPPAAPAPAVNDLERAVDTIIHMKDLSELAVDLAYSSVLFANAELAEEVQSLEIEVDAMQSRLEAWVLQAASETDDPVALRGLIHLSTSTEAISDAAIHISEGVLRDIDVHPVVRLAVQESDEIISRVEVSPGSDLAGTPLVDGVSQTTVKMSVLAIRRPGEGWRLVADTDTTIEGGDVLIVKGTRRAAETFDRLSS